MNAKAKMILSLFVSFIIVIPVYIILHEGGHALVALLCGGRITAFSVVGAYMSFEGGSFTTVTMSLFHAAGMLLPVLAAVVYMLTYRSNIESIPYRMFSLIVTAAPAGSVFAWIFVPVLYLAGQAPPNDDVTKFIDHSGLNPWAVMLAAVVIIACYLFIAWKKKIVQTYWKTVNPKNQKDGYVEKG